MLVWKRSPGTQSAPKGDSLEAMNFVPAKEPKENQAKPLTRSIRAQPKYDAGNNKLYYRRKACTYLGINICLERRVTQRCRMKERGVGAGGKERGGQGLFTFFAAWNLKRCTDTVCMENGIVNVIGINSLDLEVFVIVNRHLCRDLKGGSLLQLVLMPIYAPRVSVSLVSGIHHDADIDWRRGPLCSPHTWNECHFVTPHLNDQPRPTVLCFSAIRTKTNRAQSRLQTSLNFPAIRVQFMVFSYAICWLLSAIGPTPESVDEGSRKFIKEPKCFRISDVPSTWNNDDLLDFLRKVDGSLATMTLRGDQLSLYPACCGSGKTALLNLNLNDCPRFFHSLKPSDSEYVQTRYGSSQEESGLVIDRHFYGLTPLNTPEGEVIAESVFALQLPFRILIFFHWIVVLLL
jgi:hypothetical protein